MRDLIIHNWPLIGWDFIGLALLYAGLLHGGFPRRRLSGLPPESGELKHDSRRAHISCCWSRCWWPVSAWRRDWSRSFRPGAGSRRHRTIFSTWLLGDSRRMFANSFYVKADEYYHSGYYPTIFDDNDAFQNRAHGRGHRRGQQQEPRRRAWLSRPAAQLD